MQQPKILVAIRKRPLSKKQQTRGDTDIIAIKNQQRLIVSQYKQKVDLTKYLEQTVFNFDFAFDQATNNEQIYYSSVRPLVDSAFQGAKVTCFAYGQTGSGKTFTMNGVPNQGIPGLYTLGAQDIFTYLADSRFSHLKAKLSFFEIYCGKLFDLLNKRNQLKLRQDNKNNVNIIGLQQTHITSWQQFMELLAHGASQRVTSQNSANLDSSRSHAILQISLKDGKKAFGKISFIDLAGNQRGADHMDMSKQTRIDGAQINKSLLALKQCIRALDQGKGHTPFRGSKLTMVLKDSFVGFCRTIMIGNISPSSSSSQNTLNTLRYADRVKQLRKPNQVVSKQDQKAKQLMLPRHNKNAIKIDISKDDDAEDIEKKRSEAYGSYGFIDKDQDMNKKLTNEDPKRTSYNKIPLKNTTQQPPNIKQPINNVNATKINMVNNKRTPLVSQNQIQQVPSSLNFTRSYEKNEVPTTIYKNMSSNIPDRGIQFNQNKMDIENGRFNQNNSLYGKNQFGQSNVVHNNFVSAYNQQQPGNYGPRQINFQQKYQQSQQIQQQSNIVPQSTYQPNKNSYQGNNFNNNYSQVNYAQQKNCTIYNENHANNSQKGKYMNYQMQLQPTEPLFKKKSQVAQDYEIPNNWDQSIDMISTATDPNLLLHLQESISQNLLIQQTTLMEKHSNTLRKQIDTIKQEMALISKLEVDRNSITTREYVAFLQDSIEEKLSSLQLLRQNLMQFTYKLDQVQEVQERIKKIVGHSWDDQQLLDDLN